MCNAFVDIGAEWFISSMAKSQKTAVWFLKISATTQVDFRYAGLLIRFQRNFEKR